MTQLNKQNRAKRRKRIAEATALALVKQRLVGTTIVFTGTTTGRFVHPFKPAFQEFPKWPKPFLPSVLLLDSSS